MLVLLSTSIYLSYRWNKTDYEKTAFIGPGGGMRMYTVCPQGMWCSKNYYVRVVDVTFGRFPAVTIDRPQEFPSTVGFNPETGDVLSLFVDDHTMFSTSYESHLKFLH